MIDQQSLRNPGSTVPTSADIDADAFLAEIKQLASTGTATRGRLIFALDATASRRDTWDMACTLQGQMFGAVASIGGLNVQLVYYRDLSECRSSRWVSDTNELTR